MGNIGAGDKTRVDNLVEETTDVIQKSILSSMQSSNTYISIDQDINASGHAEVSDVDDRAYVTFDAEFKQTAESVNEMNADLGTKLEQIASESKGELGSVLKKIFVFAPGDSSYTKNSQKITKRMEQILQLDTVQKLQQNVSIAQRINAKDDAKVTGITRRAGVNIIVKGIQENKSYQQLVADIKTAAKQVVENETKPFLSGGVIAGAIIVVGLVVLGPRILQWAQGGSSSSGGPSNINVTLPPSPYQYQPQYQPQQQFQQQLQQPQPQPQQQQQQAPPQPLQTAPSTLLSPISSVPTTS